MSPAFESFLARLYVDREARARFVDDPRREAAAAGLSDDEIAAALRIDGTGLELAAASFAQKRARKRRPANPFVRVWRRMMRGGLVPAVILACDLPQSAQTPAQLPDASRWNHEVLLLPQRE